MTVFVSFGDVIVTDKSVVFQFVFVKKKLQNSLTADAENVHHHLEDDLDKYFWNIVGNYLFSPTMLCLCIVV